MDWLDALGPTLLILAGSAIGWFIKFRTEELRATEEKLRSERRKVYEEILDPYIRIFTDSKGQGAVQALKKVTSYEYRRTAFELNLFGSDEVVRAYNELVQYTYQAEASGQPNTSIMMRRWGRLLLEIRRSLGNRRTRLDEVDMLRGMIKDIDQITKTADQ